MHRATAVPCERPCQALGSRHCRPCRPLGCLKRQRRAPGLGVSSGSDWWIHHLLRDSRSTELERVIRRCGEQAAPRPQPPRKIDSVQSSRQHRSLPSPQTPSTPSIPARARLGRLYTEFGRNGLLHSSVQAGPEDPGIDQTRELVEIYSPATYRPGNTDPRQTATARLQCLQGIPRSRRPPVAEGAQCHFAREAHLRLPQCPHEPGCLFTDPVLGGKVS